MSKIIAIALLCGMLGLGYSDVKAADTTEDANDYFRAMQSSEAWRKYLSSEEKMKPLAVSVVNLAVKRGLTELCQVLQGGVHNIKTAKMDAAEREYSLSLLWIISIEAAILLDIDPVKNPEREEMINTNMNYLGGELNMPDPKATVDLTILTLMNVMNEEAAKMRKENHE